jgi:hypothetical protein
VLRNRSRQTGEYETDAQLGLRDRLGSSVGEPGRRGRPTPAALAFSAARILPKIIEREQAES